MATQQVNRTQYSNGSLGGNALPTFDGTRAKAKDWMRRFKVYKLANKTKEQMAIPLQRVGVALSYIIGPRVDSWVEGQVEELEDKTTNKNYAETDERLWKEFETNFNNAFTDLADDQRAHMQLLKLSMAGEDLDTYTADFNRLYKTAGFTADEKGTMELYKNGLNSRLLGAIIDSYQTKPATLDAWQKAARDRQIRYMEKKNSQPGGLTTREQRWAHGLKLSRYTPKG
jgi:Retrotransposon gag protein